MVLIYLIIGLSWAFWLEYFTTNYLEGDYGEDWKGTERLFHILIWPYSLGAFLYGVIKEINNKK